MKNQVKDPLDKLFSGLQDSVHESPSPAFLQDLEARLDALEKKRRKPLFAWWIFSALGAVLFLGTYFILVPTRAKSKVPNKSAALVRSTPSSSSKSKSTSSLSIRNATWSTSSSINKSSTPSPATTKVSSSINNASSLSISAPTTALSSSKVAALSSENIDLQQETYVINPILLYDDHPIDSVSTLHNEMPQLPIQAKSSTKRVQHQLGLQFGVSGIISSFEVDQSGVSWVFPQPYSAKEIREWRELGERNTSSWDFNLRYQCQFAHWGFQTGLNYLEWGEQYKYEVISVEGTNRYQYVQIPLGLSYRIPLQKLTLQPAIGVGLGYGIQRNGAYILPQNNGVALVESRKFVLNTFAQFEIIYQVNEQIQFSVSPLYRYAFGQVVSDPYIKNKYQSLGLLTGFMFNF